MTDAQRIDEHIDVAAERAIVGSVLRHGRAALSYVEGLDPGDLFGLPGRAALDAVRDVLATEDETGADLVDQLGQELTQRGELEQVGGFAGLAELEAHGLGAPDRVVPLVERVRDLARTRRGMLADSELRSTTIRRLKDGDDLIEVCESALEASADRETGASQTTTYAPSLIEWLGDDEPEDDGSEWVVQGVLPSAAPCAVAGVQKVGKTMIAEDLGIAVAAGQDWLGHRVVAGRVLLMMREDQTRVTRRRVWRLARGRGIDPRELAETLSISVTEPFYFDEQSHVDRMRKTLDLYRPQVLIIDSLARTHRGDENSVRDMQIVTSTWADFAMSYECSVCLLHHFNGKGAIGDERSPGHKMRGTSDLFALVRNVVGCEPIPRQRGRMVLRGDGNMPDVLEPLAVEIRDGVTATGKPTIEVVSLGPPDDVQGVEIDRQLIEAIAGSPDGLGSRKLREAVTGDSRLIDRRIRALETGGRIWRASTRSHFFVTEPSE